MKNSETEELLSSQLLSEIIPICPITQLPFTNPVVLEDGHSYEKEGIEKWLKESSKNPLTRVELNSKELISNITLKSMIETMTDLIPKVSSKIKALLYENSKLKEELSYHKKKEEGKDNSIPYKKEEEYYEKLKEENLSQFIEINKLSEEKSNLNEIINKLNEKIEESNNKNEKMYSLLNETEEKSENLFAFYEDFIKKNIERSDKMEKNEENVILKSLFEHNIEAKIILNEEKLIVNVEFVIDIKEITPEKISKMTIEEKELIEGVIITEETEILNNESVVSLLNHFNKLNTLIFNNIQMKRKFVILISSLPHLKNVILNNVVMENNSTNVFFKKIITGRDINVRVYEEEEAD